MKKPSFFTLLLMISFASVNAVLFTPGLPNIANYFAISDDQAQQTITWFLIAYALGQLVYGPLANRYGRKPALYMGIGLQIFSSFLCVLSAWLHFYTLLVLGRFLLALGSGVGLKMTFTLVNESYTPKQASQKTSYLMLAFAITPGLGVALGGLLNTYFDWTYCFYAGALYGLVLLILVSRLPETLAELDYKALKWKHLIRGYSQQFKNRTLVAGGFLMGCVSAVVYVFAALAPFIAINLMQMSTEEYGFANLIPAIGMIIGSLTSAQLVKFLAPLRIITIGVINAIIGISSLYWAIQAGMPALYAIFVPMAILYFGLSMVIANASTLALSHTRDKAHGSAVMNFINMGFATLIVLLLANFKIQSMLLPQIYLGLCLLMLVFLKRIESITD